MGSSRIAGPWHFRTIWRQNLPEIAYVARFLSAQLPRGGYRTPRRRRSEGVKMRPREIVRQKTVQHRPKLAKSDAEMYETLGLRRTPSARPANRPPMQDFPKRHALEARPCTLAVLLGWSFLTSQMTLRKSSSGWPRACGPAVFSGSVIRRGPPNVSVGKATNWQGDRSLVKNHHVCASSRFGGLHRTEWRQSS